MLRTRLYLGLLPLLLLLAATGGYALYVCRELAGTLQRDLVENYRDILACQQMRYSARLMADAVALTPRDPLAARRDFDEARASFTSQLMAQSASSAGTLRAKLVEDLDNAFTDLASREDAMLNAGAIGTLDAMKQNEAALFRVLNTIEQLNRRDFNSAQETARRAQRMVATTERVLLIAIGGSGLLSIFLAWRLAASLLRPIRALTESAVAVGEGDLVRQVPEFSRDELGRLAQTFNQMSAKLRAYRDAMQARVLRTQRTMESTLTSAPDPVFVVDRTGTIEVRNPAAEILSAAPEFAGGLPPALAEPLEGVLTSGEHYLPTDYGRVITLRVGREDRHYLPRILAIGDHLTEFRGAAVILQDVTKFRLLDDAKTNLVGTVSHELKTPLTSLRMAVYLLLEQRLDGLTPTQRELLETVRDDAERLLRILDNLLDLARLEAGASSLDRQEISVADLVESITTETRTILLAKEQKLAVTVPPDTSPVRLGVDVERLRHVFINLLTNAAKYSPLGATIAISARSEPGFVRFAVRDEGPGIPAESVAHVFDRFYRAPGQTRQTGAGLGLAIAREIVVAHGGSIACETQPGRRGTEFYFLLPR